MNQQRMDADPARLDRTRLSGTSLSAPWLASQKSAVWATMVLWSKEGREGEERDGK